MKYFDAHCHVQFTAYDEDRDVVLAAMVAEEVAGLVVGTDAESSRRAVELVQGSDTLWASIGLHPNAAEQFDGIDEYHELAQDSKVVAIGECGLDNFRPEDPDTAKKKQREVFEAQIQLAIETGKPLMIHSRPAKGSMDAYLDTLDMVRSYKREHPSLRGDMHFFVGDVDTARQFIELDFTLSYTAVLTFTHDYDEAVRFAPLTHLLSETDSPYVAPAPNRGKRNVPNAVIPVIEVMAQIRGEESERVRAQVLENARNLFRLP